MICYEGFVHSKLEYHLNKLHTLCIASLYIASSKQGKTAVYAQLFNA